MSVGADASAQYPCLLYTSCQAARPGASYAQLYREADQALYRAKRQGRGMCVLTRLPE